MAAAETAARLDFDQIPTLRKWHIAHPLRSGLIPRTGKFR